ncbi:unnamed protein product [Ostreobium quekettii]|uniref:Major facilitator superfamily (MFS) profile domain-containing protein n=1 Tax=Ostreobium quekettii TaxID=121088 RepID=A0A8S1IQ78_9CHLO|nr:unnamed protein product [Ostreobium quekettii]|eukprot:evm.model.scf_16.3 EVM.evm.TU.scf_16.3   scf_16:23834-28405(-)
MPARGPQESHAGPSPSSADVPSLGAGGTCARRGGQPSIGPIGEIVASRSYRLFLVYIVFFTGQMLVVPYVATMQTDFFATSIAGESIECTGLAPGVKPPRPCIEAHSDVVAWSTWSGFVTNAVVSAFINPALGTWSDLYGRKPFLVLGFALQFLPYVAVLLYLENVIPLYWFWPASVLAAGVSSYTLALAYFGDVISMRNRTVVFGFWTGTFYTSSVLGSFINVSGLITTAEGAVVVTLTSIAAATALTLFWIPESLPSATRLAAQQRAHESGVLGGRGLVASVRKLFLSAWTSLKILTRNSMFVKLAITVMIIFVVLQESMDFMIQYLQEVVGFNTMDQSVLLGVLGVSGLFALYVVLWFLLAVVRLSEKWVLVIGIVSFALEQIALAAVYQKWQAYAAVVVGSLGGLAFPAIQSIKSMSVGEDEQGAIQGALVGARSFGTGIGPLLFLALFNAFRRGGLYYPGAPFIGALVLELVGLGCALTIKLPASFGKQPQKGCSGDVAAASSSGHQEKTPLLEDV